MADIRPLKGVIQLLRKPTADTAGIFSVKAGKTEAFYAFQEIPCFIGGRGFDVMRLGTTRRYHVRAVDHRDFSCECIGYLAHGRCRHALGLLTLIDRGEI